MIERIIIIVVIGIIFSHTAYAIIINKEEPIYYFVNQEEQIQNLREKLLNNKKVGITGITGIGKSEMARKYVQKYKQDYDIIAFLDASIDLVPQLIHIAIEINKQICIKDGCHLSEDIKNVKNSLMEYLQHRNRWILIFDNLHINENDKIKDIIDWYHNGHVIICSQDSKYLLQKISVPYLDKKHTSTVINKVMKHTPPDFIEKLTESLQGYPTYMIGHSAIFLQNNNHMAINEYIKYVENHDNKLKAHLNLLLKEMTKEGKNLLYKIALFNNQRISRHILEQLENNQENLSNAINELIRFGIIEQISEDRSNQIFRMHDSIKEELLKVNGNIANNQNINNLLAKLNVLMSSEMINQFFLIIQDKNFESNLEVLLNNAEKYNASIYEIMTLKSSLLGYYLRSRESYNAKKQVDWFKKNEKKFKLSSMNEKEKVIYSRYLGRIGRYEYFVVNHHPSIALQYLAQAKNIIDTLPNNYGAKVAIYFEIFQIQVFIGDIIEAENNLHNIERVMLDNKNLSYKASMVDYGKARIFLVKGEYKQALSSIVEMLDKEKLQLNKSRESVKLKDTGLTQEEAWLAPIYILQAEILNYMRNFNDAYNIANNVYNKIKNTKVGEISSATLAYSLTELSRSELGLNKKDDSLNHATEAINILIQDQERNNKENDLDNSEDILLANALVAKADALSTLGKPEDALNAYKLAKNIYLNIYKIKNIGNMDNVSYAFAQTIKITTKLPDKTEGYIQCSYFYTLLLKHFGLNHLRSKELHGVCG